MSLQGPRSECVTARGFTGLRLRVLGSRGSGIGAFERNLFVAFAFTRWKMDGLGLFE